MKKKKVLTDTGCCLEDLTRESQNSALSTKHDNDDGEMYNKQKSIQLKIMMIGEWIKYS